MRGWLGGHRQRDGLTTRTNYSRCRPIPALRHQQRMATRCKKMYSNQFLINLSDLSHNPPSSNSYQKQITDQGLRLGNYKVKHLDLINQWSNPCLTIDLPSYRQAPGTHVGL